MTRPRIWYLLQHRPGPAAIEGVRPMDQPGFEEHLAFLRRRAADGTLIAAGPLEDNDTGEGEGVTVLAAQSLEDARRLAEQDDESVRSGLLAVTVRTWTVVMSPALPPAG
ncbi:YciI family protein [Dactylosporangium darangshiense]|uniref:YCII-related domain-containing protein n=1 Tax=Dactylosporangium darangshiense TaxID=579108 RepID=A0ABP8DJM4_9ACTN